MSEAEFIRQVRTLLQREGWIQGKAHSKHGWCLNAAMYHLASVASPALTVSVVRRAEQYLVDVSGFGIVHFNDHKGRTIAEIYQVLDDLEEIFSLHPNPALAAEGHSVVGPGQSLQG
jgi:hypothetical protein